MTSCTLSLTYGEVELNQCNINKVHVLEHSPLSLSLSILRPPLHPLSLLVTPLPIDFMYETLNLYFSCLYASAKT